MKIVFFGSDQYSEIVLKNLKHSVLATITPGSLNRIPAADIGILASFGAIISKEILNSFPQGILNVHPSLLPKYRGPSPVQTAILNGEKETGVTIIKMDELVDHGPIVAQVKELILPTDTSTSLYGRLFEKGAKLLNELLEKPIKTTPQDHAKATFTKKFTREDGKIDWHKTAVEIDRQIRALYPWPGTWTDINSKRLKILKAHLKNNKLVLDEVQLEGKKPVTFRQFLQGYPQTDCSSWPIVDI